MKKLEQYSTYTRKDVHRIFSPDTVFTPSAGTWGLHGIVKVPSRPNDFVFFVTLKSQQGDHAFDESISSEGVLSWQSQPSQGFENENIKKFISHNELYDNIYLFFRESKSSPYTYLGKLAYINHDIDRECPVYFQWQILNWDAKEVELNLIHTQF